MQPVPAALLRAPIAWQVRWGPELDPVVDGDRAADGKQEDKELNREGGLGKVTGDCTQMRKGKEQKQVQQHGDDHPEGHNPAEECCEGGADRKVHFGSLPVQDGVGEGGDIEFIAAHQAEYDDGE